MVDEKIIVDTVKRMLDAEIDEPTIIATLKDIGLDEAEARKKIESIKNEGSEKEIEENDETGEVELTSKDRLKSMEDELNNQSSKSELHETTTHNMLNEHAEKIENIDKKIGDLHESVKKTNDDVVLTAPNKKLDSVQEKLIEISARQKALEKLLKDILDANRKILNNLEK